MAESSEKKHDCVSYIALVIAGVAVAISLFSLYLTELRYAKIKIAPITDLSVMMFYSDIEKTKRIWLMLSLSLSNLGAKHAWIDNIKLNLKSESKEKQMVFVGRLPAENFGHNVVLKRDFQEPFYPITIAPKSQLAFVPTFAAEIPGNDLTPLEKYNARIEIIYGDDTTSELFEFIINRTKQELDELPPDVIYRFTTIGISRKYQKVRFGD